MATNISEIGSGGGRDYSTLTAWEAAKQADLVTAGDIEVAECYNDSTFTEAEVFIYGWTTGANNYIRIYTPAAERHDGTAYSGVKFSPSSDDNNYGLFRLAEGYIRIEGLIINPYDATDNNGINCYYENENIKILNNIFDIRVITNRHTNN